MPTSEEIDDIEADHGPAAKRVWHLIFRDRISGLRTHRFFESGDEAEKACQSHAESGDEILKLKSWTVRQ